MSGPVVPQSSAVLMIVAFTWAGVSVVPTWRMSSATPATNGVAMLVPLNVA